MSSYTCTCRTLHFVSNTFIHFRQICLFWCKALLCHHHVGGASLACLDRWKSWRGEAVGSGLPGSWLTHTCSLINLTLFSFLDTLTSASKVVEEEEEAKERYTKSFCCFEPRRIEEGNDLQTFFPFFTEDLKKERRERERRGKSLSE